MFQIINWLYQILLDERAQDVPAAGGEGEGGAPAEGGEGDAPGAGEGEGGGGESGQGEEPPATPAFGEFGDTPQTLEEAVSLIKNLHSKYSAIAPEYENLKGKTSVTERNLALTRKALEQYGIKMMQDEDGNWYPKVIEKKPTERTKRFQETHAALFDKPVLEAIRFLIQDIFEDTVEEKQKTFRENQARTLAFNQGFAKSTELMFSYFPMLDGKWGDGDKPTNPAFNQAFHDAVIERVKEKYSRDGRLINPQGELMAALEVAKEMGIPAQVLNAAKKEGFEAGKLGKKILGPAGQGAGAKAGAKGKMSFEEYNKLSPEEKEIYDKQQIGV